LISLSIDIAFKSGAVKLAFASGENINPGE
jgi:hypothetical protein